MEEEKQEIKQKVRQRVNDGKRLITLLVPADWEPRKRALQVTWRVIMARGFEYYKVKEQKQEEIDYFLERAERLNKHNLQLRSDVQKLTEELNTLKNSFEVDRMRRDHDAKN
jgi:prefoldin subunit 5